MASLSEGKVPVPIDDEPQPVVVAPQEDSLVVKQGVSFEDKPEMAKVVPAVETAIVPLAKEGKAPKLRVIGSSGSVHDIIDAASMREIGEKMKQHRRMSAASKGVRCRRVRTEPARDRNGKVHLTSSRGCLGVLQGLDAACWMGACGGGVDRAMCTIAALTFSVCFFLPSPPPTPLSTSSGSHLASATQHASTFTRVHPVAARTTNTARTLPPSSSRPAPLLPRVFWFSAPPA